MPLANPHPSVYQNAAHCFYYLPLEYEMEDGMNIAEIASPCGWEEMLCEDVMQVIGSFCDPFTINRLALTSRDNNERFHWRFNFIKADFKERRRVIAYAPVECLSSIGEFWSTAAMHLDDDEHAPDAIVEDPLQEMAACFLAHDTWDLDNRLEYAIGLFLPQPERFMCGVPDKSITDVQLAHMYNKDFWKKLQFDLYQLALVLMNVRFMEYFCGSVTLWFPSLSPVDCTAFEHELLATIHIDTDDEMNILDEYFEPGCSKVFERLVGFIESRPRLFALEAIIWKVVRRLPVDSIHKFLASPVVKRLFPRVATSAPRFTPIGCGDFHPESLTIFRSLVRSDFLFALFGTSIHNYRKPRRHSAFLLEYIFSALTFMSPGMLQSGNINDLGTNAFAAVIRQFMKRAIFRRDCAFEWKDFLEPNILKHYSGIFHEYPRAKSVFLKLWVTLRPRPVDSVAALLTRLDNSPLANQRFFCFSCAEFAWTLIKVTLGPNKQDEIDMFKQHVEKRQPVLL